MSTKTLFKLLWVPFVTSVFASCSDKEELLYTPPEETNDSYIALPYHKVIAGLKPPCHLHSLFWVPDMILWAAT